MKSYLITGANGFLCRHLRRRLPPEQTTNVDSFISSDRVMGVRDLDVTRPAFLTAAREWVSETEEPVIFHMAGIASPYHYRRHPFEALDASIVGTRHVLEAATLNPRARVVVMSSSEIYGDPPADAVPTPETYRGNVACLGPRACYDEGKRVAETLCQLYAERYGVNVSIVRPFNVYGPGMSATDYRVMPQIREAKRLGTKMRVFGTGQQTRTFCYVDDAIDGILAVAERGAAGEPYNIGNPEPEISMIDLCLLAIVQVELVPYPAEYPGDEPMRRCPDISKARALGYAPKVGLVEGLGRFFDA
jgi:UDP-glucuronate decarboxylase